MAQSKYRDLSKVQVPKLNDKELGDLNWRPDSAASMAGIGEGRITPPKVGARSMAQAKKDRMDDAMAKAVPVPKINLEPRAKGKDSWKNYKSVAAAKKAGSKYYIGKDGKKKAALFKEDLDPKLSKRDAYNKALGLKRADGSAVEKAKPKKDAKKDTKKKSCRERRAARMEERLASDSIGEGRKKRIKKRLSRVKRRMGEPKGYAKGGKVRGAGIAQRGVRPCKMR